MDELELLGTLQDAFEAALEQELGDEAAADLGFPATLLKKHTWVEGNAEGEPEYDLSNGAKSATVLTLTVDGIVQFAGTYAEARTELKVLWDAVSAATPVAAAAAGADHIEFGKWRIREGKSPEGFRQLGFFRDIEFTFWLG